MIKFGKTKLHAAFVVGALFLATGAQAVTYINLVGTRDAPPPGTPDYIFGTVTCTVGCKGVLSGSLSDTTAFAQDFGNANPGTEAMELNALLSPMGSFVTSDTNKENNGATSFTFSGKYIALKVGKMTAFLFNSAGVSQTLTYSGNSAGGLSHKTNIGLLPPPAPTPPVPLPATGLLLLGALGGMAGFRKFRKARA